MGTHLRLAIAICDRRNDKGVIVSPAAAYSSQLAWTDDTVSYDDDSGRRIVLDFANQQKRKIDQQARTVTVEPLQVVVSFRDAEARNRGEHIYEVLKAGGLPDNPFAPVLAEHQLSVSFPSSRRTLARRSIFARLTGGPDIEIVDRQTQTDMIVGARCLMSVSHESQLQPDAVAAFTHFIRHAFGGHPCVLQHILDARQLPTSVTLGHLTPMHGGEVTIRVEGPADAPHAPSTDGFDEQLPLDGSEPIDAVLRSTSGVVSPPIAERFSEALAQLQGATPLEGLLTFIEVSLEQPVRMPPELAAAVNSSTDDAVPRLIALLAPSRSEDDARTRLRVLDSLRGRAGRRAYLLGVFEAPLLQALNQPAEARAALTKVLEASPRVTGAWKDLGDLFCPDYDFTRAWLCWQRARSIAPTHSVLKGVDGYERALETAHPEYFRIG